MLSTCPNRAIGSLIDRSGVRGNILPATGNRTHQSCLGNTQCRALSENCSTEAGAGLVDRRLILGVAITTVTTALNLRSAEAIQGLTAGRIPGLSQDADDAGFFTYQRPEGKSGGHGVGWSEIPRYAFKVPSGWGEIPVSIADLGGTEIDLRYSSKDQGEVSVVVAPILRFADIGFNAKVTIEQLGAPDKIIKGFAPELFGKPIEDEDILESETVKKGNLSYYQYHVKPYRLVSCTAYGNRMFLLSVTSSARQWRKHEDDLRRIATSFMVPDGTSAI